MEAIGFPQRSRPGRVRTQRREEIEVWRVQFGGLGVVCLIIYVDNIVSKIIDNAGNTGDRHHVFDHRRGADPQGRAECFRLGQHAADHVERSVKVDPPSFP